MAFIFYDIILLKTVLGDFIIALSSAATKQAIILSWCPDYPTRKYVVEYLIGCS